MKNIPVWLIALCLLTGCKRGENSYAEVPLPSAKVKLGEVHLATLTAKEDVTATIRPKTDAVIAAQITGPLESIPVELGAVVQKGGLLARINESEIRAKLLQAEAQLQQAESNLKREQNLFEKNAATESSLEDAQARFKVASGMVDEVKTVLGYTSIRAPFDGVITQKYVNQGDLATPGKPLLLLENPASLRAEAEVPEALAANLKVGQKIEVTIVTANVSMEGTVSEISPAADAVSRTFLTKIDLPPEEKLRSGQFARAAIPSRQIETLCAPAAAVVPYGQMERVFVDAAGKAELRLVKTGMRCAGRVEILSGLAAGEKVVVEGADKLREGQPLEILP